ncbi:MAG: (2Fe-2S)-binding protein [Spirochaetes bacterium]|nr:MAG: (2Fe-2S)-binding protein [Spirochaetota bacterium]
MKKIRVSLRVNGRIFTLETDPNRRLIDVLREDLNFTGVKEGCGIGECGACTVLMNGKPVNSCLVLIGQAEGSEVVTIEGLKGKNGELHPLQEAFIEAGAVQCGYCIPGMILSAEALLQNNPHPTEDLIKEAISGNLCRCTGYRQIIDAVKIASKKIARKE